MSEAEDIWFVNGVRRKENPSSILVIGNDPRKREGARSMAKKKPKGHRAGCRCAVCARMHGHKAHGGSGGHKKESGGHPMARRRNEPGGGVMRAVKAAAWPGFEEIVAAGGGQVGIPLLGKVATVFLPFRAAQEGLWNVALEFGAGVLGAAALGYFRPVAGRVLAQTNYGLMQARAAYVLSKGKIGLAEGSINPVLHANIEEAMAALLPSLSAVLPSLSWKGDGVEGEQVVGDPETIEVGEDD